MGVYIKDMEMPKIDLEWRIIRGKDGKWYAIDVNAETSDGEWHEIVPVPPHGDLIDRREAERYALPRTEMVDGEIVQNKYVYLQTIQQLPTIIPAEEGE